MLPFHFHRAVFIYDFDLAKEMAFSDKYSGRIINDYTTDLRGYGRNTGMILTEGHTWKINRKFSLSKLKGMKPQSHALIFNLNPCSPSSTEFGFGKQSMVSLIEEEARDTFQNMAAFKGQDFIVDQTFTIPVFNVLWKIVGGKRYGVSFVFLCKTSNKCQQK